MIQTKLKDYEILSFVSPYVFIILLLLGCSSSKRMYYFSWHTAKNFDHKRTGQTVTIYSDSTASQHLVLASPLSMALQKETLQTNVLNDPVVFMDQKQVVVRSNSMKKYNQNLTFNKGKKTEKVNAKHEKKMKSTLPTEGKRGDGKKNWKAVVGFILSLLSLFPAFILLGISIPLSITAVIFCIQGLKSERKGLSIVGLTIGVIASIFGLAFIIYHSVSGGWD